MKVIYALDRRQLLPKLLMLIRDSASNFQQALRGIQASALMFYQWPGEVTNTSEERVS